MSDLPGSVVRTSAHPAAPTEPRLIATFDAFEIDIVLYAWRHKPPLLSEAVFVRETSNHLRELRQHFATDLKSALLRTLPEPTQNAVNFLLRDLDGISQVLCARHLSEEA